MEKNITYNEYAREYIILLIIIITVLKSQDTMIFLSIFPTKEGTRTKMMKKTTEEEV
jgi:hypothetical protein